MSDYALRRGINDECSYKHRLHESTGPGIYNLDPIFVESCKPCHMPLKNKAEHFAFGIGSDRVDIDLALRKQYSDSYTCDSLKYDVYSKPCCKRANYSSAPYLNKCMKIKNNNCSNNCNCECAFERPGIIPLDSNDTRSHGPCRDTNGLFINRFDHLCQNPQQLERVIFYDNNRRLGAETRLDIKDSYPYGPKGHTDCWKGM